LCGAINLLRWRGLVLGPGFASLIAFSEGYGETSGDIEKHECPNGQACFLGRPSAVAEVDSFYLQRERTASNG